MTQENEQQSHALTLEREPGKVLAEAKRAASMLKSLIEKKEDKVIINGKQYIEFEDWQLLGHFYGLSVRVSHTERIEIKGAWGWKAAADVYHIASSSVIASAEAICMRSEDNWKHKPEFQLASMAETRACAKAFRNCLSWVVVLAGYAPETVEEASGGPAAAPEQTLKASGAKGKATLSQVTRIWADAGKMGYTDFEIHDIILTKWGVNRVIELTVAQASALIDIIDSGEGLQSPESEEKP